MTILYVPGNRPDRFQKALASGAQAIIIDLEDSVPDADKATARDNARDWLRSHPAAPAWVRVNNRPDLFETDLAAIAPVASLGIVLPKADARSCRDIAAEIGPQVRIVALVESAVGVLDLAEIARSEPVVRLALGEADLCADLDVDPSPDGRELWSIRSQVVTASAACGLEPPIGPVFTDLDDLAGLRESSQALRRQGFGTRSAIHPAQVPVIAGAFAPSTAEIARAQAIVAAYEKAGAEGGGVAVVDGVFVDEAVIRRARRILG